MNLARSLVTLAFCAHLPLAASAATREGVTLPDETEVAGKKLVLNGLGVREATIFNVHVYVAGLYLEEKSNDPAKILAADGAKQLVMVFKRDVEREKMVDAYKEGFEHAVGDGSAAKLKARLDTLTAAVKDMKDGQRMVLTYVPGTGTTIEVAGKLSAPIPGADFSNALFGIYLGPKPPNKSLKEGLLGRG